MTKQLRALRDSVVQDLRVGYRRTIGHSDRQPDSACGLLRNSAGTAARLLPAYTCDYDSQTLRNVFIEQASTVDLLKNRCPTSTMDFCRPLTMASPVAGGGVIR